MARSRGSSATAEAPPQNDAYVGMLVISFIAMLVGCIFLYMDYAEYPDSKAPNPPQFNPPQRTPEAGTGAPGGT